MVEKTNDITAFARRLRELREEKKMSQIDLCANLYIQNKTISDYERGKSSPDFDSLSRIANFFDVSVDYLLGVSDNRKRSPIRDVLVDHMPGYSDMQFALFDATEDLSDDDIWDLIDMAKLKKIRHAEKR